MSVTAREPVDEYVRDDDLTQEEYGERRLRQWGQWCARGRGLPPLPCITGKIMQYGGRVGSDYAGAVEPDVRPDLEAVERVIMDLPHEYVGLVVARYYNGMSFIALKDRFCWTEWRVREALIFCRNVVAAGLGWEAK